MIKMRILSILVFFTVFTSDYLRTRAAYINITGCPSLYLYIPDVKQNQTIPPCFCDNATSADDPPVLVNCFTQSTFDDLTRALSSVQKSGKKVTSVNLEDMTFDSNIGIPDHYFQKFGLTPSEITIVGCQTDHLSMNYTFSGLEKSLKKLTISGCNVLTVPPSIANLTSLESLTLQDTYIYTIYKDDFRGLKNLKYLDLTGNQIIHVEEGAFNDLYNVETAILGPRNSLNESALGELNKLTSARKLVLYNNYLHELPDNALNALRNLQELDLSTNYIENITSHSFAGLRNLTKLTLAQNILKLIDDGSFRAQTNLRELDIEANFIEDLWPETFQGLSSLEQLNLDWNNFYVIDRATFAAMPQLRKLSLRKNMNLQYVDPDAFDGLRNLRVLNFSLSNLTTITPDLLKPIGMQLEVLNVSGSGLSYLGPDAFHYGAHIQTLSMAETQLSGLPKDVFAYLTHLKYLDLSKIKWICDDQLAWLVRWLKEKTSKENLTLISSNETTCWEPLELRNQPLVSVDPSSLRPYVAPTEIEQPPTTSTTAWLQQATISGSGGNDTDNSSSLIEIISTSSATTTKPLGLDDLTAVRNPSNNADSNKIKIVIAVVASIVTVATIAVIVIVVLIMRRRKRKQNQQSQARHIRPTAVQGPASPGRPKPADETEMSTTHMDEANGAARNGYAPKQVGSTLHYEPQDSLEISRSSRHPSNEQSNDPSRRSKPVTSDEV